MRAADYHTSEAFQRELARFAGSWVAVCRSNEVVGPGAQKRTQVATTEVLVTRGEDGSLSAISNVCRHRGSLLVEDGATAPMIRCPYHLWTYGLDGRFRAAPFMEGADLSRCDLPRYAVAEWAGFVFVNLDRRATPPAPMFERLRVPASELARWQVGFRIPFEHDWNWKVMVENFAESYHHIGAHAQSLQPIWPGGESDASRSTNDYVELRHTRHPALGTFTVYVVFPMFMLAVSDPFESVYWYRMVPRDAGRIGLEIIGLFPERIANDAEAVARHRANLLAIHMEDIPVCERTQAGLRSADAVLGPLSRLEDGVARFREWVAAD